MPTRLIMGCVFSIALGYAMLPYVARAYRESIPPAHQTVMAVGGSNAAGWDDNGKGGYLAIAFRQLSSDNGIPYTFVNKSVAGYGPIQFGGAFNDDIQEVKPTMVVMAYGILDDLHNRTPINTFKAKLHDQIQSALESYATVEIVSAPISRATYTNDKVLEPEYIKAESQVVSSIHSNRLYFFDINSQMKQYLAQHHQSYVSYVADGWHLNSAGHELAGQLLASDMQKAIHHPSLWSTLV